MLSSAFELSVQWLDSCSPISRYLMVIFMSGICALLLWRLWTFTVLPYYRPDAPPEIPYWVPGIGHVIPFFNDMYGFLFACQSYLGDSTTMFCITLLGNKFYVVQDIRHVTAVLKNTSKLTFDLWIRVAFQGFGLNSKACDLLFLVPPNETKSSLDHTTFNHLSFVQSSRNLHRIQLSPGERLSEVTTGFSKGYRMQLNRYVDSLRSPGGPHSLMHLCEYTTIPAFFHVMLEPTFFEDSPGFLDDFLLFSSLAWKVLYGLPWLAARDAYTARDRCIETLKSYLQKPTTKLDDMCWMYRSIIQNSQSRGFTSDENAKLVLMMLFFGNANPSKTIFWMLSAAILDNKIYQSILAETQAAWRDSPERMDPAFIENSPALDSLYNETLRILSDASSVRDITSDIVIGGKLLRKGGKILIPYRLAHHRESTFGSNPSVFDPFRFYNNKELESSEEFRPFGGGTTWCSGRFFAKKEVYTAIAILLKEFYIRLDPQWQNLRNPMRMPRVNDAVPWLGIMGPVMQDDPQIMLIRREPQETSTVV